jgi:hypothetical protein
MNNLNENQIEKIQNFFNENELNYLNVNDYLSGNDFEYLDFSNAFVELLDLLDEKNAFDCEIIYYSEAMKFLTLHDTSLTDSIEIAIEYGVALENINSELLASLLASKITREAFWGHKDEIENFFTNFDVLEFTDK